MVLVPVSLAQWDAVLTAIAFGQLCCFHCVSRRVSAPFMEKGLLLTQCLTQEVKNGQSCSLRASQALPVVQMRLI